MNKNSKIAKQVLINRNGLKVIRLKLPKGEMIPEHSSNADVLAVVVSGEGIFFINGQLNPIQQGEVIELHPEMLHSIVALTNLELIVNQMQLKTDKVKMACDIDSCTE